MESTHWPADPDSLKTLQTELALLRPAVWSPDGPVAVGGCFVCFSRGGSGRGRRGEPGWAGAVVVEGSRVSAASRVTGESGSPYVPGLLSAREGPLLESVVLALSRMPDVLLVNATGLDHPRRAGLALHLGWVTGLPTVGVTHRPLVASGGEAPAGAGSSSPLMIDGEHVGWRLRTREDTLPVAVSPGWRTDLDITLEVVMASVWKVRTPEPIRQARELARTARSRASR